MYVYLLTALLKKALLCRHPPSCHGVFLPLVGEYVGGLQEGSCKPSMQHCCRECMSPTTTYTCSPTQKVLLARPTHHHCQLSKQPALTACILASLQLVSCSIPAGICICVGCMSLCTQHVTATSRVLLVGSSFLTACILVQCDHILLHIHMLAAVVKVGVSHSRYVPLGSAAVDSAGTNWIKHLVAMLLACQTSGHTCGNKLLLEMLCKNTHAYNLPAV